jgi:murein DD-endopeptidase MepM/ murein hydrolase activator NlpD
MKALPSWPESRTRRKPSPLARALSLAAAAALLTACASGGTRPTTAPAPLDASAAGAAALATDTGYLRSRGLMVPVVGVTVDRLSDTFYDRRGEERVHRAIDILAPRGTPVVAADDGSILRVSSNALGGLTIYASDPSRRLVYYYAHLDRYEIVVHKGKVLAKGDVIGYVGTTGNARGGPPHLHFQVMRYDGERHWWDGEPIDPFPYFATTGQDR